MILVKQMELRQNLKKYCDLVHEGEDVVVPRVGGRNVVIISEKAYQNYQRLLRNEAYLKKLDRAFTEAEEGKLITMTLDELEQYGR